MGMSETGAAAEHGISREDLKGTVYELFILAISILSIVNLALLAIFRSRGSTGGSSPTSTSC